MTTSPSTPPSGRPPPSSPFRLRPPRLRQPPSGFDRTELNMNYAGESLPVTKMPGDIIYSGSTCKQGEIEAVVIATGVHTFFGGDGGGGVCSD